MKTATIAITALVLAAPSVPALAEDYRIGGEVGLYHTSERDASLTALTEVIDADLTLLDTVAIVGGLPFVQIIASGGDETEARFRIGNIYAAAYYQSQSELLRFRVGGGVAFPTAQIPEDEDALLAVVAYAAGLGMHGLQGPWLWVPETFPVMVPSLRLDVFLGFVELEAGADIVLLFQLHDAVEDDLELVLPVFAGALVTLGPVGFGARLGFAGLPTAGENEDKLQVSLSPRITVALDPVELEARLTMNLDNPAGFAFSDDGIWGAFVGVHAVF